MTAAASTPDSTADSDSAGWLADRLVWNEDHGAAAGAPLRLHALQCARCARSSFPAADYCTWCGGEGTAVALPSTASAVAATAVLHATPGAVVPVPYVVVLARFAEAGLDVLGRVLDCSDPDAVPPGTVLHVVTDVLPDGRRHYALQA